MNEGVELAERVVTVCWVCVLLMLYIVAVVSITRENKGGVRSRVKKFTENVL